MLFISSSHGNNIFFTLDYHLIIIKNELQYIRLYLNLFEPIHEVVIHLEFAELCTNLKPIYLWKLTWNPQKYIFNIAQFRPDVMKPAAAGINSNNGDVLPQKCKNVCSFFLFLHLPWGHDICNEIMCQHVGKKKKNNRYADQTVQQVRQDHIWHQSLCVRKTCYGI